jgi:acyl-CoA reductase-like NAD-dependent aldehyde dehydrogenase
MFAGRDLSYGTLPTKLARGIVRLGTRAADGRWSTLCKALSPPKDRDVIFPDTQLFVGGAWRDADDGRSLPVSNPATGEQIGRVAHASRTDLDRALRAAESGFRVWRDMVPAERSKIMRKAAALMRERAAEIAKLLTMEQGKPLHEVRGEAMAAADIIEAFARKDSARTAAWSPTEVIPQSARW